MRKSVLFGLVLSLSVCIPAGARDTISLVGRGWYVTRDTAAEWRNDPLFLPGEYESISDLPYNPPTFGWQKLYAKANAVSVSVPGTLEEYFTTSVQPQPTDQSGVSWWVREISVPKLRKGERAILHFGSVRHRAEVFIDSTLVGYDMVAETPFDVDITNVLKPGSKQQLAVRITHPGGNYHWQDFTPMDWGNYKLPPSRGFGGILAPVTLDIVPEVSIADIYIQNQPVPTKVKAIITIDNSDDALRKDELHVRLYPKGQPQITVAEKMVRNLRLHHGENMVEVPFECHGVQLWNIDTPSLYTCEVSLTKSKDSDTQNFGFRWFEAKGVGENARLMLNGKRIMLRTAINWGYWPVTGLYPSRELAERQVTAARSLGMNMVNFHRNIGSVEALNAADSIGLLYLEEPGGFHSATHDPFMRKMAATKLNRMVHRDRSHPSLVIYNLINEWGGTNAVDTALTMKRFNDMRHAHAIDPSRIMTFTSGWATRQDDDEFAKANMQPFDSTLHLKGWYDNHRAGGPATWEQGYYRSPDDNFMHTRNKKEVFMRGEEGALSTPPRIAKIHEEIQRTGRTGWDGLFWERQYAAFDRYFREKGLAPYFGDIDSLTRMLGDIQLDHQGRRIQGMRMQDIGDVYAVNGWEAMPYDNHSGIVDDYRNIKGNVNTFGRYTRPAFLAVCPRTQFTCPNDSLSVDIYAVNELNFKGAYLLQLKMVSPSGQQSNPLSTRVNLAGGETFGQLLLNAVDLVTGDEEGLYCINASLYDGNGNVVMDGYDEILVLNDSYKNVCFGKGAFYGSEDSPGRKYYTHVTGCELPLYQETMDKLDWVIVSRSMLDEPQPVPVNAVSEDGFTATYFRYHDIADPATTVKEPFINHTFVDGEQPHSSLPANQSFSVIWNGSIVAPADGVYMLGVKSDRGIRCKINGNTIADDWGNQTERTEAKPFNLHKGQKVNIEIQYRQTKTSGYVQLVWTLPGQSEVSPKSFFDRAKRDGTRVVILDNADSWISDACAAANVKYNGFYTVGRNWIGGVHFVKDDPLFDKMPVNVGMGWPYQALVRDGDRRVGFEMEGDDMIVGSYRSWAFHLGSALGKLKCGKGEIIYNTLDISDNLLRDDSSASVARRLFFNLLNAKK